MTPPHYPALSWMVGFSMKKHPDERIVGVLVDNGGRPY
jgi:hypothetical protein